MGVRVDEAGMEEPAVGRDLGRVGRRREAGRADLADRVALDQDVAEIGGAGGDVEHAAAAQDGPGHAILQLVKRPAF